MNPHRTRRRRDDGAALRYLALWRAHVERTENRVRRGDPGRPCAPLRLREGHTDCPACDGELLDDSRLRLERLIRNGGRRRHRLAVEVQRLDERYREVTTEIAALPTLPWWNRRMPWR
ncbi:hypothetical protein GCM10009773_06890 [Williamsia serinedens]